MARPGTAALACSTTVPVGAMMRLDPSSVDVECDPAWLACTHHWLLVQRQGRVQQVPGRRALDLARRVGASTSRAPRSARVRATSGKSPSKPTTRPTVPSVGVVERGQPVAPGVNTDGSSVGG